MTQARLVDRAHRTSARGGLRWVARPARAALSVPMLAGLAAPALAETHQATATVPVQWLVSGGSLVLIVILGVLFFRVQGARLGAERALLTGTLESTELARLVVGPEYEVELTTPAWRRLAGFDPEAPLDGVLRGLDDRGGEIARLRAAASSGRAARAELRFSDGRWRALSVRPLDSRPGHTVWAADEATPRYERESRLLDEMERLVEFIEAAPVGFYSVDQDGRFLAVNGTFADWLGEPSATLVGGARRLADFIADSDLDPEVPYAPFGGTGAARGEVTFRGHDGRAFMASITQTLVDDDDGGDGVRLHTRSLVRDLSAERKANAALRLSEERFRRFFEEAPVGIVLLDPAGLVTECNVAFAETVSMDAAQATGGTLAELVAADDRAPVTAWLEQAARGPDMPGPLEVSLAGDGGAVVSLFAGRLEDGEGDSSGLIVHVLNLSEQKALEEQFFQSQKMELVGQLAGGIAHDFNNLLTAMIGFCDLLLLRHTYKDPSFADIQQIKQNANRAANLVRQLLAFSRQQTLQPKVLNLTDVLAELSYLLRRLIGATIELKMTHGRDLGLVKVDQGQFEQVIINLAVNARDAMPDGGTLTIRTANVPAGDPRLREEGELADVDHVIVEVIDTGCGIAKEHLEKIYEPFFTTKEVGSGTGLGLATVYGIIKQTGGHIEVESRPGEGARFSIFLPRHRPDDAEVANEAGAADAPDRRDLTGAGTVLLVEDEDAVRLFGARALRNKGYHVIEAVNGEDALNIMSTGEHAIDLLITDVVMPGVDGPSLIRSVRETHPDLRVIFISGYAEDTFRQRLESGAHFLSKPFSLQQLAGKVKEVMHHDGA